MASHTSITAAAVMSTATNAVNSATAKVSAASNAAAASSASTPTACLNTLWRTVGIGAIAGFLTIFIV